MILRDPVHGLVAFEGDAERLVTSLLDTREVQRLRRVRQLGLTSLVFPGAEHSRFAHAVGAAHVMSRLIERVRARQGELPSDQRLDEASAHEAIAAALLHDLGHGPFSHLFEDVLPDARSHESWTMELLRDPGTDAHRALERISAGMADRVADLLAGAHRLAWLCRTVSGTLDVDRCDYLLRDSYMTGVAYGRYDLDWLLRALAYARVGEGEWVLAIEGRKGLPPIGHDLDGRRPGGAQLDDVAVGPLLTVVARPRRQLERHQRVGVGAHDRRRQREHREHDEGEPHANTPSTARSTSARISDGKTKRGRTMVWFRSCRNRKEMSPRRRTG
jgi:hypothetical protein